MLATPTNPYPYAPTPSPTGILQPHEPQRLLALAIFLPAAALLTTAALLSPNPNGHGTHTSLGLAPCGLLQATGIPCPTCGMTTAFALAADASLLQSLLTQPLGFLLALATAATTLVTGYALVTGMRLQPLIDALLQPRTFWAFAVLTVLAWAYTIARFQLA
ncbi:MAG: DUF2752 domain-containing protein [Planctomycetota bacterium]